MEIVTGYRGKSHITSEKWADLNRGIIGAEEYVLGVGRMFESELVSNNLLKIYDGCGVMQGRQFGTQAGKSDEITIENGTQGEKRIDLIVARYTKNEDTKIETIEPVLIKGTPSASDPAVPKHTEGNIRQGDLIADMPLYEVELNGINVVEVRPLFQVLMNMNKINKCLSDNCIGFPDYTKVLGEYSNKSFTAPENCWARIISTSGWTNTTLNVNGNGVVIQQIQNTDSYPIRTSTMIPLKKGDVVTMSSPTKVNGITVLLYPMRR